MSQFFRVVCMIIISLPNKTFSQVKQTNKQKLPMRVKVSGICFHEMRIALFQWSFLEMSIIDNRWSGPWIRYIHTSFLSPSTLYYHFSLYLITPWLLALFCSFRIELGSPKSSKNSEDTRVEAQPEESVRDDKHTAHKCQP